jgi:hypothetical protein
MSRPRRLAVVTGGHGFDVPGFHDAIRLACGERLIPYIQHLDDFAASPASDLRGYDAALFYFFPLTGPQDEGVPGQTGRPRWAIEQLLDAGIGLFVLHHALLAYPQWTRWDEVGGAGNRDRFTYHPAQQVQVTVASPVHEITAGLSAWSMVDETYGMQEPVGTPLLEVAHPTSMRTIGWARQCGASRVVCLQSGHDASAWTTSGFRHVLSRGLSWVATTAARSASSGARRP